MWKIFIIILFYSTKCLANWAGYPNCYKETFVNVYTDAYGVGSFIYQKHTNQIFTRKLYRFAATVGQDLKQCLLWAKGLLGEDWAEHRAGYYAGGYVMQIPRFLYYPENINTDSAGILSDYQYRYTMPWVFVWDHETDYVYDPIIDYAAPFPIGTRALVGALGMYNPYCSVDPFKIVIDGRFEIRYYKRRLKLFYRYKTLSVVNISFINNVGKAHLTIYLDMSGEDGWKKQVSRTMIEVDEPVRLLIMFDAPAMSYFVAIDSYRYIEDEDDLSACPMYKNYTDKPEPDATIVPPTEPTPTIYVPIQEGKDLQYRLWLSCLKSVSAEVLVMLLSLFSVLSGILLFCGYISLRIDNGD